MNNDIRLLALCMWREARGESVDGLRAVAHVIRNRHIAWKMDWQKVIMQPNQFSSMTHRGDKQLNLYPKEDSKIYKKILEIAEKIYAGCDQDLTNGALYYWNPKTATSSWFVKHVARVMEKTAVIGRHEFFRPFSTT